MRGRSWRGGDSHLRRVRALESNKQNKNKCKKTKNKKLLGNAELKEGKAMEVVRGQMERQGWRRGGVVLWGDPKCELIEERRESKGEETS